MKWSYLPPYGYGCCPSCRQEFNIEESQPTFLEKAPHNDNLVYVMCPSCHSDFQNGNARSRKDMVNKCFINVKQTGGYSDGVMLPYSITSTLTLALNDWSLTDAIENGHGLTREEYFSICSREYEVSILPGGLRVIISQPKEEAADD